MAANKKFKGKKIRRLSGKTETITQVLQGGYKTDAGGKMVGWRKVSVKGDKLIEHKDRVNPDGTPMVSKRGRKADDAKPASKQTPKVKDKVKVKETKVVKEAPKKGKKVPDEKPVKPKRIPADEVGIKSSKNKAKTKIEKPVRKKSLELFTKGMLTDLRARLQQAVQQVVDNSEFHLRLMPEMKPQVCNDQQYGGPVVRFLIDITTTSNQNPDHVIQNFAAPTAKAAAKISESSKEKSKAKVKVEPKLDLDEVDLSELTGIQEATLDKYASIHTKAVKFFGKKRGAATAKTLKHFGVGDYFVNTKTNEVLVMLGFKREWNAFYYAVILSDTRKQGTTDSIKLNELLRSCEPLEEDQYETMYAAKYGEETDFETADEESEEEDEESEEEDEESEEDEDGDDVEEVDEDEDDDDVF